MQTQLTKWVGLSRTHKRKTDQVSRLRTLRAAGDDARDRQNWDDAARFYAEVIVIDPSALDIAVQLGHAHKEMRNYDRAAELYYAVLEKTPDDDDLHLQIGHLEKLRGNVLEALTHYKSAADINQRNVDAQQEYDALVAGCEHGGNDEVSATATHGDRSRGVDGLGLDDRPSQSFAGPLKHLNSAALRAMGDEARDARRWSEAAPAYQAYLERVPADAAIWIQLGHCLKEMGDLLGGEAAYRRTLAQQPEDSDIHLQLGHVLKLLDRRNEAIQAYRRSFALKPLRAAAVELEALGFSLADELVPLGPPIRKPAIFFEISDLFFDLFDNGAISGIQRVQLGIISYILSEHENQCTLDCRIVAWGGGNLWALEPKFLETLLRIYRMGQNKKAERRHKAVVDGFNNAELVRPISGDVVVSTGTIYQQPDLVKVNARLKRAGVRLGAYIHDFIPLTHPEFCDRGLTDAFVKSIADALLYYDFALTVSEHVERELRRLLADAGYSGIPTRAVPEAHTFAAPTEVPENDWTSAIAAVQDSEFVLCVGTFSAQKNQALLLQIWQILIREGIEPPLLVLVGRRGHNVNDLLSQLATSNNLDGRVHIFEGLSDSELQTLYANCLFTMVPSFVEGWGLPVGESLAYGKLCIASDAASLPEVGGEFVLYVDPYNARAAAILVRRLLEDRTELRRLEARIRDDFRPRNWHQHGAALIAAAEKLGRAALPEENRPKPVTMPLGRVVRPFLIEMGRERGTSLPAHRTVADRALRRLLLEDCWYPMESWGAWMEGRHGQIGFTIEGKYDRPVRVVLQFQAAPWAWGNSLTIRAACGATTIVPVPESRYRVDAYPRFLAWLDCTPDRTGRIVLTLEIFGDLPEPWWGETRRFCIGLAQLLCLEPTAIDERLPPNRLVRPAQLTGPVGAAIVPSGTASVIAALQRRIMLGEGWVEPEAWGAWMAGRSAKLALTTEAAPGATVSIVLQLRIPPGRDTIVTVRSQCGAAGRRHILVNDPCDFPLRVDCCVGADRRLSLEIEATSRPVSAAADPQAPIIGITGLAYGPQGSMADRLALAEALLFPEPAELGEPARSALEKGLCFSVVGHMNGSYSLAAVNRRLALALEETWPGTVRVEQIEGQPVRDLSRAPATERLAIAALAARERHEDGPMVEISQHWPVWVPPHPTDLKLAWVSWEESLVPLDMVRLLNEKFQGILVQTHFIAKALIDLGVRLPVRVMGCAPDLAAHAALGDERAARPGFRRPTKETPFTFLHVSSCFPRKGVDVLLAAYVKEFRRDDPVRLVIKGFPNPHNDVPEQIAQLKSLDPEAPEIVMINRDIPAAELVERYAAADAVVLPTRGEGFNMPAAEALAAGLPLIVTGYSGQTDFAGADVARQVAFHFAPSRSHARSDGSLWAEPDVGDLALAMRELFKTIGDAEAERALAVRIERGRWAAAVLGDGAAWAARVRDIAIELLSMGAMVKPLAPTVAWVTTWNIRCGIATHSKYLLDPYPDAARDVTVLCDERTPAADLTAANGPQVRAAWQAGDLAEPNQLADRLARAIVMTGAQVVVIQHQPGLIRPEPLTLLLTDTRLAVRDIILTVHNLGELVEWAGWDRLLAAFRRVSRLLVHNSRDLNLLKSWDLIDNVTLLPPGALPPRVERHPARDLTASAAPLLGTYGFFLPHKGFDTLIKAFVDVRAEWPNAKLRMVTAEYPVDELTAEIARCRELARSLGLEDAVEWHTDYLSDDGSLALLNRCDLVVLAHRNTPEAASGAARVAMASRVPVLVTPVGIFDEMGDAVIRADGMDAEALAAAISAALDNQKLRHDTVDEADNWLQAHDWTRMSERLYGMICGLVANRDARARTATRVGADPAKPNGHGSADETTSEAERAAGWLDYTGCRDGASAGRNNLG